MFWDARNKVEWCQAESHVKYRGTRIYDRPSIVQNVNNGHNDVKWMLNIA